MDFALNRSDSAFGPAYTGDDRAFDFTLLFEDTVLTIIPASLFMTAASVRAVWLANKPNKVNSSLSRSTKLVLISAFASIQLALLLGRATNLDIATKASVAASAVDFIAACVLFVLSCFEHSRSVTPSTLIGLYLLITLPFDAARLRTFYLIGGYAGNAIANLQSLSLALKFGVLITEAVEKRGILLEPYRELPPEATSGIYSKGLFWWLNPLLRIGFGRTLKVDDLFDLDVDLASSNVYSKFNASWNSIKDHHKHSLLLMTLTLFKWQLVIAAIPRILWTVSFISDRAGQTAAAGWGLTGAFFLTYFASAIFNAAFQHLLARWSTQIRGGLVTLIFRKTLDLSISSSDPTAALTLMSADIQQIVNVAVLIHGTWCSAIDVAIAMYLLWVNLGHACFAPLGILVLLALATAWITKIIPGYQKRWLEAAQTRVSFTSSLLHSMRNVKLLGVASVVKNHTQGLRIDEINQCKRFRVVNNLVILIQNAPSTLMPFATFLLYYVQSRATSRPLDLATSFSVLTILRVLEGPLNLLLYSAPQLASCISCFGRIQAYLLSASRQDNHLSLASLYDSNQSGESNFGAETSMELRTFARSTRNPADEVVTLRNCSFGWNPNESPIVQDIDLCITRGKIAMMIGPVGCGKSTLLKGILSETPLSRGFVYLQHNAIAFVDQETWIQNGTIKDAICGPSSWDNSPADDSWYKEVIACCGLVEDLENLPGGDMTKIGSKGLSLSGGQKQRLALARAVYSRAELLLLDDVFSGLDNDTEELIFSNLFGPNGPLRRLKTTVLLVTHAVHRLPAADVIVSLDEQGRICEVGTYTALIEGNGYVHTLEVKGREQRQQGNEDANEAGAQDEGSNQGPASASIAIEDDDELAEDLARRTGEWATYRRWFKSAGYISTALSFFWGMVWICCTQTPGLLVRYFAEDNSTATSDNSRATTFIIAFGATTALATAMAALIGWQIFLDMVPNSSGNLHMSLLNTVLDAPLSFLTRTDIGSIINRFSQDLALVDADLPFAYADFLLSLVACITGLALLSVSGAGYFAAVIPVVLLALYFIQYYYLRTSRQLRLLDLEEKAPLYTLFGETASGLPTIRAFNWTSEFFNRNLSLLDRSQRPFYLLQCIQRWLSIVLELLVTALITLLMAIVVARRDSIEPGLVGLGLLTIVGLSTSLTSLIGSWTLLETSIGAISRIHDFSCTTESEHLPQEANPVRDTWPESGNVAFTDFSASYAPASALVLHGINLAIPAAESLGICGRSGSGKSSTLASLFHLLEFRAGSLTIDGVDLAHVPRETLRRRLNVIPQEPWWIIGLSVRFNLDPWTADSVAPTTTTREETAARDRVFVEVLRRCRVWDIVEAKGGLDAAMSADFLSHGQRQLFCLARAMLRDSRVVVLDEVSANVDIKTDELMQRLIREEFCGKGCTVVSVAHRLGTIEDCDRVSVLSKGRLVEVGHPQRLLETKGSAFRTLVRSIR